MKGQVDLTQLLTLIILILFIIILLRAVGVRI
jgi:hypothetical protein